MSTASSSFRSPLSSCPLLSSAFLLSFSLLLLLHTALSLLLSLIFRRFSSSPCSCSCSAWTHHALFLFAPFSLSGDFFLTRPHCICRPHPGPRPSPSRCAAVCLDRNLQPPSVSPVGIFSKDATPVSAEYASLDYRATSSLTYRRKGSKINGKDADSGRLDDRDTDSSTGEIREEETFMSLLDEHRSSGCQCGASTCRELQWTGGKAEDESESDENGFQHGHCCEIVLALAKALQAERRHLRNLYVELEEERVAAETATNEAMAMILRLQEEKSALQLEAAHYQRMVEEKAIHDERAIQILEDDLCKREEERVLLVEELNELRVKTAGMVKVHQQEEATGNGSSILCGSHGVSHCKEPHTTKRRSCDTVVEETGQPSEDVSSAEKGFSVDDFSALSCLDRHQLYASTALAEQSETARLSAEDSDASSILIQLSALEKQLRASGASEFWDLPPMNQETESTKENAYCDTPRRSSSSDIRESIGYITEEEKVVDIDVANKSRVTSYKADMRLSAGAMSEMEEQIMKGESQESEDHEEEKYLDIPSLVTSNSPHPTILRNSDARYATLQPDGEEKLNYRKITLEDIDSRLRALEIQTRFMRQQSVPTNYEHVNVVLLKEILQELRVALHPDQDTSSLTEIELRR